MTFWDWFAVSIAVPTVIFLITVCAVYAFRMNPSDAKVQQQSLLFGIAAWMLVIGLEMWLNIYDMPVVGIIAPLVPAIAAFYVVYTLVVSVALLFRPRFRTIGLQMLIVCTLAIWWMALTEPIRYPDVVQESAQASAPQE